jgi:hypothetical protein
MMREKDVVKASVLIIMFFFRYLEGGNFENPQSGQPASELRSESRSFIKLSLVGPYVC